MRWSLALGAVVPSVWACDTSNITLIGIAPVRVDIPVGKRAKVFVAVECLTNGNDWNANAVTVTIR